MLWAHDKVTGECFKTKPVNVAQSRDYFATDGDSAVDALAVERLLAEFEGLAAPVVKKIVDTGELPNSDGLEILLHFVAMTASKVPRKRKTVDVAMQSVGNRILDVIFSTPEKTHQSLVEAGISVGSKEYTDLKKIVDEGGLKVGASKSAYLHYFGVTYGAIAERLPERNWVLAESVHSEFVTSDNPVLLLWDRQMPGGYGPGFGLKSTTVYFPLSPNLILLGKFEDVLGDLKLPRKVVGEINRKMLEVADRQVYCRQKGFVK